MGIPVFEFGFDAAGQPARLGQETAVMEALSGKSRHVVVLAHGWNNTEEQARALYADFLNALGTVDAAAAQDTVAVGVLWPSKKFPGPAAALAGASRDAQDRYVRQVGHMVDRLADPAQISDEEGRVTISQRAARSGGGQELLRSFAMPVGGAASVQTGAERLLNFATYYVMKDRAGRIGREGLNPLLGRIQSQTPPGLRFHLVGHSFGGRMVTAAADGPCKLRIRSLLLLQAAYSHNGLAVNFDGHGKNGFFHRVLSERKVTGPILITHSKHDEALGLAYPLASRLNGCDAAGIGDAHDLYGGMGANGAQHVAAACLKLGDFSDFKGPDSSVFNLNGDAIIHGHDDVVKPETAALLAASIRQCAG